MQAEKTPHKLLLSKIIRVHKIKAASSTETSILGFMRVFIYRSTPPQASVVILSLNNVIREINTTLVFDNVNISMYWGQRMFQKRESTSRCLIYDHTDCRNSS